MILLHGFPYDIHSYVDVAPQLAAQGCRVIVPYLRGFGATRFRDPATLRSGEQAAIGADVIALMDALAFQRAVLGGHNWGGRAACVAAALWPERCRGMVTVNSYLIQDLSRAAVPIRPKYEVALWYEYYFQLERGRAGLAANRREIARLLWKQWSPEWDFDDAIFDRSAMAHDNPDYVDVVIHSYRHRFGPAAGDPQYAELQRRLASLPPISVPSVTLDGDKDGVLPASDGSASASKFTGRRIHRVVRGAGHNVPQEAPEAFAAAIMELIQCLRASLPHGKPLRKPSFSPRKSSEKDEILQGGIPWRSVTSLLAVWLDLLCLDRTSLGRGISKPSDHMGRALRAGRHHRHDIAHRRRGNVEDARPIGPDRQSRRRWRHGRHRTGGARQARWLHDDLRHAGHDGGQCHVAQKPVLRSADEFPAGASGRRKPEPVRGLSRSAL